MVLLSGYVPFCILPLMIAIDFGVRSTKLVNKADRAEQSRNGSNLGGDVIEESRCITIAHPMQ